MSWSSSFSSFPSLEVQRNTSIDLRPKGPLQPNGKRSHDHSLKSWEHPWAIHNLSLQQESIRPAVSMRFPRNLYSRLVSPKKRTCFWWLLSVPAASASIFTRARRHPRSATPAALMSEIQELRFELFTARLLLARVAVHHGSTPKIPMVWGKNDETVDEDRYG